MKSFAGWKVPLLSVVLAAVAAFAVFAAFPVANAREESPSVGYRGVLRLWHIDGFEGGVGSRASFLGRVARAFEAGHAGLFLLITVHTAESAAYAIAQGDLPDMISCGGDNSFAADVAVPLQGYDFPAGKIGAETYGVPWCRGAYFLYTAEGDFSDVGAENTLLSAGRGGHPFTAAYCEGLRGDFASETSTAAYLSLMRGDCKYMLGTQRDFWRFQTREFAVQAKALSGYGDLWQYILITEAAQDYAACLEFVSLLLSEEVQDELPRVGMLSAFRAVYEEGNALHGAEKEEPARTIGAWLGAQALSSLEVWAQSALNGDENGAKNLEKILA